MVNTKSTHLSSTTAARVDSNGNAITRMHSSMKRPRAPIACIRCHHKKVRCDGEHPNCARCTQGGVLCAYPSSRRSRNTQSTSVDPFIDNLSQLEVKIQQIESDLESQKNLFLSYQVHHRYTDLTKPCPDKLPPQQQQQQQQQQPKRPLVYSNKRSFPQDSSSSHKKMKQQKKIGSTPRIKTPTNSLSSSPSSASTEPTASHPAILPPQQNYMFPSLDPFSCHTDWSTSNNHLVFSDQTTQYPKETSSIYPPFQPYAQFTSQQPSPLTTPDYTDDGSEQLQMLSSSSSLANENTYRLPSSYPYTPVTTLNHTPQAPPPQQQQQQSSNSCHIMDFYNNFSMDDLISFDSQNPAAPIMDNNAVWYC